MREALRRNAAGVLLLTVGAVLLILGAAGGDAQRVYMKAARICLECIGIG